MILQDLRLAPKDLLEPGNKAEDILVLLDDLVTLQASQAMEPHLEDRLRLQFG